MYSSAVDLVHKVSSVAMKKAIGILSIFDTSTSSVSFSPSFQLGAYSWKRSRIAPWMNCKFAWTEDVYVSEMIFTDASKHAFQEKSSQMVSLSYSLLGPATL